MKSNLSKFSNSKDLKVLTIFYVDGTIDTFKRNLHEFTFLTNVIEIFQEGKKEKVTIYSNCVKKTIIQSKLEYDEEQKWIKGELTNEV